MAEDSTLSLEYQLRDYHRVETVSVQRDGKNNSHTITFIAYGCKFQVETTLKNLTEDSLGQGQSLYMRFSDGQDPRSFAENMPVYISAPPGIEANLSDYGCDLDDMIIIH